MDIGTNTTPKKILHDLVNLDALYDADSQPGSRIEPNGIKLTRKKKACKTCQSESCRGLINKKGEVCPDLQVWSTL